MLVQEFLLDDGFLQRWARRAVTVPLYISLCILFVATLPLLLAIAAVIDIVSRKRWILCRSILLFTLYFCCEAIGIVASFVLWVAHAIWPARRPERFLDWNFALQRWWAGTLFRGARVILGMEVRLEGIDELSRGPVIVFIRHASIADTLLPAMFIANPNGIRLRYVLKRQLLWDPCLDIVGNRLPNCFVRRELGDSKRVQKLIGGLSPRDGVLIYPEGTRFSAQKLARSLAKLADSGNLRLYNRAIRLRNTLPPRLGGALSLLGANPGADVIFCAHEGFEGVVDMRDFLRGSLIGKVIRIRFWRVAYQEIPIESDRQAEWLFEQWGRLDEWVTLQRAAREDAGTQHSTRQKQPA